MPPPERQLLLRLQRLLGVAGTAILLVAAAVVLASYAGPLLQVLHARAQEWKTTYPIGVAVAGLLVVCFWIVCLIPSTPIELTLGYLYGIGGGLFCVYIGKVLGCLLSFLLGRTLLRDFCQQLVKRHELLQAIDLAVQDEPYRISFLARGAYIPIALKNYGFSVLSVPPRAFVTALVTVEVWNSASLVFLGHAAESVGDVMQTGSSGSGARVATLVVACAALLGLSAYGSVATRRALAKLRRQRDPADAVSLHAFQEKLVQ